METISIIIPSYKPENYLYRCIDSIANQSINTELLELILIINGPKEPYMGNLRNYISQFSDFKIVLEYCPIAHVSSARNMGLQVASGRYVAFIDDDDFISECYFESLLENIGDSGIVFSNIKGFSEESGTVMKNYMSRTFEENENRSTHNWMTLRSHMSVVWGKLFPAAMVKEKKFHEKFKNGQDALFMALIQKDINEYDISSSAAIYYWTERAASASRRPRKVFYEIKNAFALMLQYAKIYFRQPFQNNPIFFAARILAVTKRLLRRLPESSW